ncbi:MAG TPA: hypothetical protein VGP82_08230 [Ktedonobacterales bacterium]|nr:hypothetical protein [Ktedonobacterales bacterium]
MTGQDYDPREEQAQEGMRPGSISDSPRQAGEMPDVQRDQGESYERQNTPGAWSPSQQTEDTLNDSDDATRGEQPQYQDQRQAAGEEQASDDDYGKGLTGGQWKNQSDQDY